MFLKLYLVRDLRCATMISHQIYFGNQLVLAKPSQLMCIPTFLFANGYRLFFLPLLLTFILKSTTRSLLGYSAIRPADQLRKLCTVTRHASLASMRTYAYINGDMLDIIWFVSTNGTGDRVVAEKEL